jgi:hypothetical protein
MAAFNHPRFSVLMQEHVVVHVFTGEDSSS